MSQVTTTEAIPQEITPHKAEFLLAFYRQCWDEMTWRRNSGYRTIIIGLGYCGVMLAVVAYNQAMRPEMRVCLSAVLAVGTAFGSVYLASNYRKYMAAAAQTVLIEEFVGAYDPQFLGSLGALMPPSRRARPRVPLSKDPVCLGSIIAFALGGFVTALAILLATAK